MNHLTHCALFALVAALPLAAQSPANAPADRAADSQEANDTTRRTKPGKPLGKKPLRMPVSRTVRGTLRGERTSGALRLEREGAPPLPLRGHLLELLRDRAMGRTLALRVVVQKPKKGGQPFAQVLAARGTAMHDLPVYAPKANVEFDAPIGTLREGSSCWVHSGGSFGVISSSRAKGKVLLSGIEFGTLPADPTVAQQQPQTSEAGGGEEASGGMVTILGGEREDHDTEEEPRVGPR